MQNILLFTRYPQPGKVKTRLISHLGEEGAADLHSRMTEQVIRRLRPILNPGKVQLQVHYYGGSKEKMKAWLDETGLSSTCPPVRQQGNDLGERMANAFVHAWTKGAKRVLLIGSDCPDLDAAVMADGLKKLHSHEMVLGPAADGGYYLIGLRAFTPGYTTLFRGIDWGTEQVMRQTIRQAKRAEMSFALLPELHDIDRPEDLVHFNYHPGSE